MMDAYKIVRHLLKWGYERRIFNDDLTLELRRPIKRDPRRVYVDRGAILRLLASMASSPRTHAIRDRTIMATCYYAALRISEVLSRRPEDVDLNAGVLRVYGKGGKVREIPIVAPFAKILREWLARRDTRSPWLFPAQAHNHGLGGALDAIAFRFALRKHYLPRAGIKERVSPHVLRRSAARILRDRNVPLEDIQDVLGHMHISTTMGYVGRNPQHLKGSLKWL